MATVPHILAILLGEEKQLEEVVRQKRNDIDLLKFQIAKKKAAIVEEKSRLHLDVKTNSKLEALSRIHGISMEYLLRLNFGRRLLLFPGRRNIDYKLSFNEIHKCPICGVSGVKLLQNARIAPEGEDAQPYGTETLYILHLGTHPGAYGVILQKTIRGWNHRKNKDYPEFTSFLAEWERNKELE